MEEVPRRTSLVPLAFPCVVLCLIRVETEGLLDTTRGGRGSCPLYGGTFVRSYSVSSFGADSTSRKGEPVRVAVISRRPG